LGPLFRTSSASPLSSNHRKPEIFNVPVQKKTSDLIHICTRFRWRLHIRTPPEFGALESLISRYSPFCIQISFVSNQYNWHRCIRVLDTQTEITELIIFHWIFSYTVE
jgi:hypothetical protein